MTLISNSEIQTFKRCRRKWWLAYELKLTPVKGEFHGPRRLGTKLHAALQAYYQPADIKPTPRNAFLALHDEDERFIRESTDSEFELAENLKALQADTTLGLIMLDGYMEWIAETGADEEYEVVAAEREVRIPIDGTSYELGGKLDVEVVHTPTGRRSFLDHKSCQSFVALQTLHLDEQMLKYQLLKRLEGGEPVRSGLYNMLRKVKRTANAKPPFYRREEAYHSDEELRGYYMRVLAELAEIDRVRAELARGVDPRQACYPTPMAGRCSWDCDFFEVCPLFDDGSNVELALVDRYKTHDPYARYTEKERDTDA